MRRVFYISLGKTILLLSLLLLLPQTLEAREDACCEKTTTGQTCQFTALRNCDQNYQTSPKSCEQTQYCQPVCCVDENKGVCYPQVGAATCTAKGGTIDATNPNCNIAQCSTACCTIGDQCIPSITKKQCEIKAQPFPNIDKNKIFNPSITNAAKCSLQCKLEKEGCCARSNACTYTKGSKCQTGTFYEGIYCSDDKLPCNCITQVKKGCIVGEDDVYWFDSCGNKESIAQDCDYDQGTTCIEENEQVFCKNLDCSTTKTYSHNYQDPKIGGARKNGESWCVYESAVDNGKDLVGSRHYIASCIEGNETLEACKDLREEICLNQPPEAPKNLAQAECEVNEGKSCVKECNTAENALEGYLENKACCAEHNSCSWISNKEKIQEDLLEDFSKIINIAFKLCSYNQCDDSIFYYTREEINSFNIGTLPYLQKEEYLLSELQYITYEINRMLTNVELTPEETDEMIGSILGKPKETYTYLDLRFLVFTLLELEEEDYKDKKEELDTFIKNYHLNIKPFGLCLPNTPPGLHLKIESEEDEKIAEENKEFCSTATVVCRSEWKKPIFRSYSCKKNCHCTTQDYLQNMNNFCKSLGDCGASYNVLGDYTLKGLDITGDSMPSFDKTLTQQFSTYLDAYTNPGKILTLDVFDQYYSALTVRARSRKFFLGLKASKVRTHIFTCKPWRPIPGGDKCERCSDDIDRPCSAYKCHSLGKDCKFLEKEQVCIKGDIRDATPATITPWKEILTEGYKLSATPTGYYIDPDVGVYSSITFGIKTNEYTSCKISDEITNTYEEMTVNFGGEEKTKEHEITLSPAPGKDYTYYVRCQDTNENSNDAAYTIQFRTTNKPDLEPPRIIVIDPLSGFTVPTGLKKYVVRLYLNEPSECKWSKQNQIYALMPTENSFSCDTEPTRYYNNYECIGTLQGIEKAKTNQYYIICKDLVGNEQQQAEPYTLKGT